MYKVIAVSLCLIMSQVVQAEEHALQENLERLEELQYRDFLALGELVLNHEDSTITVGHMAGDLVAWYSLYLQTDPDQEPEIIIAVLDADLSEGISVGDGIILDGMSHRLGFEYQEDEIVSIGESSQDGVPIALRQFAHEVDVVTAIAGTNQAFESLNQTVEHHLPTVRRAHEAIKGPACGHAVTCPHTILGEGK